MMVIRPSFHRKMALIFLLCIMILIGLSSTITYWKFNEIMRRQVLSDLNQIMAQNKVNLDNLINGLDKATLLLYTDHTVMNILNSPPADYMQTYDDIGQLNNELAKYMFIPLNSSLSAYTITFFVSPDMPFAEALYSGKDFFYGFYNGNDTMRTSWYRQAVEADGRLIWFTDPAKPEQVYIARLIKNPEALSLRNIRLGKEVIENVGVVVIGFRTSELGKPLEASKLSPSTELMIVDSQGTPIYSLNPHHPAFPATTEQVQSSATITHEGTDYVINRSPLAFGWQLLAFIPVDDISVGSTIVRYIVGLSALSALCAGIFLSYLVSSQITAPIRNLARTMKTIMLTDRLNVYMEPPKGNDEVDILYQSFNNMMTRIRQLLEDVYESGVRLKEAELRALQAQINPHFLYNTLDSVNWLALESGVDEIAEINSSLSSMYRYIMKDANDMVTLEDELQQIRHYVNIQSICYPGRFEVHYDLPPELLNTMCPKLIFQPLVENAIVHGIEKSCDKGRIDIRGYIEDQTAVLTIADNGAGCSIEDLNAFLEGKHNALQVSQGYGIRNVNRRIQLKFGDAYGLHYEPGETRGVTAIIRIPA
ncbi:sensor histidine kinase YesM [Paenibacillus tyrfis]|uniref:cache domain-containing sensor histidine kinase n=1 Tax=Paenibacillus tyrfis TaxID=1501230 RepID=UPI002493A2EA|nr:sensor histidine kinase [Paenibacillus tyrfis]GLI08485.1 sensor histidine kinase YesM [Paenibacillus tyrfis]